MDKKWCGSSADGTGECQDEAFVKVLTEKGKRNNRSLSLYYAAATTSEAVKVGNQAHWRGSRSDLA